jgi:predicted GIY-YIG superfamily endonuclease
MAGRAKDGALRSRRSRVGGLKTEKLMFYTYILRSISNPTQRYIGHTADLRTRLEEHNSGKSLHTAKFRPWKVETYIAFESLDKAQAFERYLKTGSGHEFARRHF